MLNKVPLFLNINNKFNDNKLIFFIKYLLVSKPNIKMNLVYKISNYKHSINSTNKKTRYPNLYYMFASFTQKKYKNLCKKNLKLVQCSITSLNDNMLKNYTSKSILRPIY